MYSCLNYKSDGEVDDLSANDTEVLQSLKWVKRPKAIKPLTPSDQNTIERLFNSID